MPVESLDFAGFPRQLVALKTSASAAQRMACNRAVAQATGWVKFDFSATSGTLGPVESSDFVHKLGMRQTLPALKQ